MKEQQILIFSIGIFAGFLIGTVLEKKRITKIIDNQPKTGDTSLALALAIKQASDKGWSAKMLYDTLMKEEDKK